MGEYIYDPHPVTNYLTFFLNTKPLVDNLPLASEKLHDWMLEYNVFYP
jgi:hypothetical protein